MESVRRDEEKRVRGREMKGEEKYSLCKAPYMGFRSLM